MNQNLPEQEALQASQTLERLLYELKKRIVGQEALLERLLVALFCNGHVLVEGAPGLAKTLTLKSLADVLALDFKRIQFTPDILPSDLTGTQIYVPGSQEFKTERGPLFTHFVLADEINRAPAKVQSALLEAMQEKQITLGKETHQLQQPFLVMATQNPLESEGTYPLPEAQLDRFLMKILVGYPSAQEEITILQRMGEGQIQQPLEALLNAENILALQDKARRVYLDPALMQYIVNLIQETRTGNNKLRYGASPRGSLALAEAGKARALLHARNYVTPEDIDALVLDCLRHRILLSYEALVDGQTADDVLKEIQARVSAPVILGA